MGIVWSLLALFASAGDLKIVGDLQASRPEASVPAWAIAAWQEDGERLLSVLPGDPSVTLTVEAGLTEPGRLDIAASTEGSDISIRLSGDGWLNDTEKARRLLRQNLAHEIAHVPQLERFDSAFEPVFLHEGYAEARSLDLLIEAKLWTVADARRALLGFEQRCLMALRRGPLWPQIQAEDRDATYACGAVIVLAAASEAGMSVDDLHKDYAAAMVNPVGLGPWARSRLGRPYTRSIVRFLTTDHSRGATSAIEGLRAGRL
ncbi:MAG: hypothetical protein AAGA69_05255 [Pseudomonadota bacterium]